MANIKITLYKNSAPPNKVNKAGNLTNAKEYANVTFTENGAFNILSPSLYLNMGSDISTIYKYNYVYIPMFKRYYYIDSISAENGLIRINCRNDVLMSHKESILSSKQYILRNQKKNTSPYLEDNMLPITSDHAYLCKPFGQYVDDRSCGRVVLATTGKGGTLV